MSTDVTIVGIGEDGLDGLGPRARAVIEGAEVLVGGERHLDKVSGGDAERVVWGKGFEHGVRAIRENEGKRIVVLASGDPMYFGVGATLARRFGFEGFDVIPAPGAFSLAAARMGWSLPDTDCLTVHGRPLETVNLYIRPGARLLILSWDGDTAAKLAKLLVSKGFGDSNVTTLEHMGGAAENRITAPASNWPSEPTADLNTIAVECVAGPEAVYWPRVPGLPEEAFEHDGNITKREVRAATLARLAPLPGEMLWDVGAGSGAVAIEWLRAEPSGEAVAMEHKAERTQVIARNAAALGVPGLKVIEGVAPDVFVQLEGAPDAIFVGGGVSVSGMLEACWDTLSQSGRLVSNSVTLEAQQAVMDFRALHGGDITRIDVSRAGPVGELNALRPFRGVLQLAAVKS